LTVAVAGVALPVSAHLAAGGSAELSGSTALVLALVAAVTVGVSSREWTLARLVATLVPVQALVHVSLAASGGHAGGHAGAAGTGDSFAAGFTPTGAAASTADTAMVGWHVVGLALVVLWLRGAERALLWFVALVQRLFVRPQLLMLPMLPVVRYTASSGLRLPLPLVRTSDSRGPPQLSFT
jgi:hypothetical protein